jgi:glycosyltransferase involved in cell wall biosynthesis
VGHLDTSFKRHQLTIQAVSKLANVDLLILGYGESKEQFEMMGEQLMPGRLKIMGVPHNDVVHYYKSADCFALPSLGEPFGIVYIEAMASGLPCIGTDDKTRREIIGEAGFVCNVEDAYEYADTINKALNIDWNGKPLRRAELYDYSIIGEKYCEMIEKMLDDKI